MKKLSLILILIIFTISFSSCEFKNIETTDRIESPNNNTPPISGKWKIEKYEKISDNGLTDEEAKEFLNKEVLFHEEFAVIGNDLCLNPSYKIKSVSSEDYLLYQYKLEPKYLDIENETVLVITLTSEKGFLYEFITKSDDEIITNIDGVFFYLTKISDNLDEKDLNRYIGDEKVEGNNFLLVESKEILRSGLLLGLRYYEESDLENGLEGWKYRTIWIPSKDMVIDNIYEMEDLFLPRKTGFWNVAIDKVHNNGKIKDVLYAHPLSKRNLENKDKGEIDGEKENSLKTIIYLGNDYISLESNKDYPKEKSKLITLPIDNIKGGNPIKISDIAGESGRKAFYEGAAGEFSSDHKFKNNYVDIKPEEESFGLIRRNGHWIMKGRVNALEDDKDLYKDFNIKIIPPKDLVGYDELSVSWNEVKLRVPGAIDVITSPNEDIALIFTNNNILIYPLEKGELSKEPIKKIKLYESENIVMAEWATGEYVYKWEEEFLKNIVSIIED